MLSDWSSIVSNMYWCCFAVYYHGSMYSLTVNRSSSGGKGWTGWTYLTLMLPFATKPFRITIMILTRVHKPIHGWAITSELLLIWNNHQLVYNHRITSTSTLYRRDYGTFRLPSNTEICFLSQNIYKNVLHTLLLFFYTSWGFMATPRSWIENIESRVVDWCERSNKNAA